jgi:hypothetical protein
MEILETYDVGRAPLVAAALAARDYRTMVHAREATLDGVPERPSRRPLVDPFAGKDRRAGRSVAWADPH